MKKQLTLTGFWLATAVLCISLIIPHTLQAHGGGTLRLDAAPVGPYELSIWTLPEPLKEGEITHITAFLFDQSIGDAVDGIVLGANIDVSFVPLNQQSETLTASASHDDATLKYLYEAETQIPADGPWEIVIQASGPKGGGEARFTVDVEPAGGVNWTLIGGIGIGAVVILWLIWQQRQAGAAVEEPVSQRQKRRQRPAS